MGAVKKKKKEYCKAHTSKSILSFKSLNSGSQMPLLNFVILKDKINVNSVFSSLLLLKEFDLMYCPSEHRECKQAYWNKQLLLKYL